MKRKDQILLEDLYVKILSEAQFSTTISQPDKPQTSYSSEQQKTSSTTQNNTDNQKHLNYFVQTSQFFNSDPRSKYPQEIQKTAQQLHTILTQTKSEPLKAKLKPFLEFLHRSLSNLNSTSGLGAANPAANFVAQKISSELPDLIKILKQQQ